LSSRYDGAHRKRACFNLGSMQMMHNHDVDVII